ncbi:gonadotropin subunit beta-1-like [Sebastes fasciatus]|uniref:gonadotropin subunit beta-1-like n=1 Tax=Sebastes fasciatus TaxID=394691 RepID=UPI003D9DCF23
MKLYRYLRCTRQRMQLVVMAAVLALAGAGQDCRLLCHLTNIRIPVEGCNQTQFIDTTICEGQCHYEDPVYSRPHHLANQKICNGEWSYEVKRIEGCPVFTYPVARTCDCVQCNADGNTNCERFPGDIATC